MKTIFTIKIERNDTMYYSYTLEHKTIKQLIDECKTHLDNIKLNKTDNVSYTVEPELAKTNINILNKYIKNLQKN
jgi:hypothetical protein